MPITLAGQQVLQMGRKNWPTCSSVRSDDVPMKSGGLMANFSYQGTQGPTTL